ncbi:MAG TPA: PilZ domain-containing protein [Terriglobales bacterium]|jgi:PilZ domain|nr:PilZ domain-containing protein [Terriglobales bacterium]
MEKHGSERRRASRVQMSVPVSLRPGNGAAEQTATTRDLSSNGVFFYTKEPFRPGAQIEIVLILPPELAGGTKRWACCQASILRVENPTDSGFGIAATIDNLDLLPEIEG